MAPLIWKDFRSTLFFVATTTPIYLLFVTQTLVVLRGFVEGYIVLVLALSLAPMIVEHVHNSEATIRCLPVDRNTIVSARYIYALLVAVVTLLSAILHLILADSLLGVGRTILDNLLSWTGVTLFVSIPLILLSLMLPLVFRLGIVRGSVVFALSLIIGTLLYFSTQGATFVDLKVSPFFAASTSLSGVVAQKGAGLLAVLWIGLTLLILASRWIATRLYARRQF